MELIDKRRLADIQNGMHDHHAQAAGKSMRVDFHRMQVGLAGLLVVGSFCPSNSSKIDKMQRGQLTIGVRQVAVSA